MKKGDPCPCGKCRFWAYEKTASGLRARWRTKAAYEKLATSNVRRQHAKRHEIRGLTTIRPDKKGIFPVLGPGKYSVALGNGSQFEVVVFGTSHPSLELRYQHRAWLFTGESSGVQIDRIPCLGLEDVGNFWDFVRDQFEGSGSRARAGRYLTKFCQ